MSESEYTLSNIERTAVMDPAAVFSKTTPKPWPVSTDFKDIHSLDQMSDPDYKELHVYI